MKSLDDLLRERNRAELVFLRAECAVWAFLACGPVAARKAAFRSIGATERLASRMALSNAERGVRNAECPDGRRHSRD